MLGLVVFLFFFFIVLFTFLAMYFGAKKGEAIAKARFDYQKALEQLKSDPTNPDLRQSTLALGRTYSNLTRNEKGETVFDELAVMNDINAACAAATAKSGPSLGSSAGSIEERLQHLARLRSAGLIDDEDVLWRKRDILNGI